MEESEVQDVEQNDPDAAIAEKWAEIQGRMTDDAPEESTDEAAADESQEERAQKARDERGRFAKADAAAEGVEAPVGAETQPQAQAPTTPEGWDINRPPASLSPSAKTEWDKLPESWRREIHKREADAHRGVQQILPDARLGNQIRQMVEPYRSYLDASGTTPEAAVVGLLRTDQLLRTGTAAQKQQAFANLAQQYGIDLAAQQYAPEQQPQQEFRDPRLDQFFAMQQRQEQQRMQGEQQRAEQEVGVWLNESDAQGKPLRPFVDNVHAEMVALIPAIQSQKPGASTREVMEEAYTRAVWANPATQSVLMQQKLAELEANRRAENLRKVEDAKRAASVNVARRGVVPPKPAALDMRDSIAENARALGLL